MTSLSNNVTTSAVNTTKNLTKSVTIADNSSNNNLSDPDTSIIRKPILSTQVSGSSSDKQSFAPTLSQTGINNINKAAALTKQQRIESQSFNPSTTFVSINPTSNNSSEINTASASEQLNHVNVYSNIVNNNNIANFPFNNNTNNSNVNISPNITNNIEATTNIIPNNYNKNEVLICLFSNYADSV